MGPTRTCVGCRATGPRSALLRVVVVQEPVEDIPPLDEVDEDEDDVFRRPDVDATLDPEESEAAEESADDEDDDGDGD